MRHHQAVAQYSPPTGAQLGGHVLPIEPMAGDVALRSLRAWQWTIDDTQRLLLEGDVRITIGGYSFSADAAAVWINRLPSATGEINQIAIYFDRVDDPTARAGFGAAGAQLLVTASARGAVSLTTTLMMPGPPSRSAILAEGERRLAAHLAAIASRSVGLERHPQVHPPPPQAPLPVPTPGAQVSVQDLAASAPAAAPAPLRSPLFMPEGSVRFAAGRAHIEPGEIENTITLTGGISIDYASSDRGDRWSQISLAAERAVIFTDPGPLEVMARSNLTAGVVRGIYLEGDVRVTADDGRYAVRAPRAYYDLRADQAVMVDAVLRTYSRESPVPVHARARELRQVAADQWTGQGLRVSTSEFYTPHLAIGAERVTITQQPGSGGEGDATYFDSRGNTVRAGHVPVFYWPRFSGRAQDIPIRGIKTGTRDNDGLRLETTWDAIALLGLRKPEWVEQADLKLDVFTERGAAIGGELDYRYDQTTGLIDLYGLYDDGVDRTSSGVEVEQDNAFRGVALWEHMLRLDRYWSLQLQASYISDASFITTWRDEDFAERREYETSAYLKHLRANAALTLLTKYDLNDFVSNDYLLASQGFTVDRVPELSYRRYGDSMFDDALTYSSEYRVSRMRFRLTERTPNELGVPGAAFGIADDEDVSAALEARGLSAKYVNRVDTRHELSMPREWGIFKIVPFVVGRFTGYDDDFESFSSDADDLRFYGSGGLRGSTQFQSVSNGVESRLFDLHRMRHIIEPRFALWGGYSSVDESDLPEYDAAVESLAATTAAHLGVRQTWQTQRGGPGRWRSVDFLIFDASMTVNGSEANDESPSPQFFIYRPEYSQFGDHARGAGRWLVTDALAFTGEIVATFDDGTLARSSVGTQLIHSPFFTTSIEYRRLDASDNELLDIWWDYQITRKYALLLQPQWDFNEDEFRAARVRLTRSFPDFDLALEVEYDRIRDDTTFGASIGRVEF